MECDSRYHLNFPSFVIDLCQLMLSYPGIKLFFPCSTLLVRISDDFVYSAAFFLNIPNIILA